MKAKKIIFSITLAICFGYASSVNAQTLTSKEINTTIAETARLVKVHYVSESKGNAISAELLMAAKSGAFRSATSWDSLSTALTAALKKIGNDGHLYVRNNPEMVKSLLGDASDTAKKTVPEDPFFYGKKALEKNYGFREVRVDNNVGYIRLSEINLSARSLPLLTGAMRLIGNCRALIIDLRDNGGGGSDVGPVLESYFLPKNTPLLEVRGRSGTVESRKTVNWLLEPVFTNPLYILVNHKTASAAEAFAFVMQANKRAVVIGQTSAGAANMNEWYPINEHLYISVSLLSPSLPGTDKSWEQTGVIPDITTAPGKELVVCQENIK